MTMDLDGFFLLFHAWTVSSYGITHSLSISPTFRHSLHPVALFHDEQDILTDFQYGGKSHTHDQPMGRLKYPF
jgi:hypothetical protein